MVDKYKPIRVFSVTDPQLVPKGEYPAIWEGRFVTFKTNQGSFALAMSDKVDALECVVTAKGGNLIEVVTGEE